VSSGLPAISPTHPTLVREPFHRDRWIYEEKYDGWRMFALKDGEHVRLVSRNGREHTPRFPDIAHAIAQLAARTLILDGEICAFDAQLISHIYLLDANPEEPATPPVFMAFDCLYQRGRDLRGRPLSYRRQVLEDALGDGSHIYAARRLHPHGLDAWAEVKPRGYEGLVAKRESSAYRAGSTRDWLKVKVRHEGRFVVVGLDVPLAGACSLLLAARTGRRHIYVGRCRVGREPATHRRTTRAMHAAAVSGMRGRGTRPQRGVDSSRVHGRGAVQRTDAGAVA
jgi:bifunctional non-homologous end joining protein LigD